MPRNEPPVLIPSVERLTAEVEWQPGRSLEQGLAETIGWWRGQSTS